MPMHTMQGILRRGHRVLMTVIQCISLPVFDYLLFQSKNLSLYGKSIQSFFLQKAKIVIQ